MIRTEAVKKAKKVESDGKTTAWSDHYGKFVAKLIDNIRTRKTYPVDKIIQTLDLLVKINQMLADRLESQRRTEERRVREAVGEWKCLLDEFPPLGYPVLVRQTDGTMLTRILYENDNGDIRGKAVECSAASNMSDWIKLPEFSNKTSDEDDWGIDVERLVNEVCGINI